MKYQTSNPVFSSNIASNTVNVSDGETLNGAINKCFMLLGLVFTGAIFAWTSASTSMDIIVSKAFTFMIAGFVIALITIFKKEWAGYTAPLYSIIQGLVLGSISKAFEVSYPGIVMQTVLLTFGTTFGLLAAYRSGLIKVTEKFYAIVAAATMGIFVAYLATWILGFFHISVPMINSSGTAGILFSGFVVIVAALNLVLDFNFIASISDKGYPKYIGWYAAFGLMVTLIWLYLEILHMLAKLRDK